ncbi:MAG TPA: sugar phosphate isomerase/epimerase [Vicinamibacterales bacterium]|nr:sugar phosphate isomerase/epimerase [Vicinamibacterales bacterium]
MYTRRDFGRMAAGAIVAGAAGNRLHARETLIGGVRVGAISYCFRSIPRPAAGDYMDTLIDAFRKTSLATCELESVRVEPEPAIAGGGRVPATITPEYTKRREELRQWRLTTPLARFTEIRGKFQQAGIDVFGYVVTFSDDFTDAEIDRSFQIARTLGVGVIGTNQTRVPVGPRLAPFAEKYGIALGWHNHANVTDPTEVASVESFERLFAMSKQFKANLDIGHFVAGNNDPVAFIRKYHDRISHLHLKDRRRDNGPNAPWGQGETPVADVLRLLKTEKYPIIAVIEYEYMGEGSAIEEVNNCVSYMRKALA